MLLSQLAFLSATRRADRVCARLLQQLAHQQPDAASRRVQQDLVTLLDRIGFRDQR